MTATSADAECIVGRFVPVAGGRFAACGARRTRANGDGTVYHASWMNLVEVWFSIIERQAIDRCIFRCVGDPNTKIRRFINGWNDRSHPFAWTKTVDQILK